MNLQSLSTIDERTQFYKYYGFLSTQFDTIGRADYRKAFDVLSAFCTKQRRLCIFYAKGKSLVLVMLKHFYNLAVPSTTINGDPLFRRGGLSLSRTSS